MQHKRAHRCSGKAAGGPGQQIRRRQRLFEGGPSAHSITCRAVALQDEAAALSLDLAALASRTDRENYACAALHLRDATAAAWHAAEVLAEGTCV